jgi:peptidoglycan hydrolase-like protein with peptidoglycan-binding domain
MFAGFPLVALAQAKYEIILLGDKDKYVLELQQALYEKGYLKHKPTGYFGTDTQNAVIAFQKDKKLTADGKAGIETRKAILGSKYSSLPPTRKTNIKNDNGTVKYEPGDKGDEIKKLQQRLKALEYYTYSKITGYYGPKTQEAVRRFQRTNGLKADGILGEETVSLLNSDDAKYYTIYPGDKSDDVKSLQQRLKELGYYKSKEITGYFGTDTQNAVKSFQKINGLNADGKVGKNTRKILFASSAKKSTGSTASTKKTANTAQTKVEKMLNFAKAQLGKKYIRGREGPNSFDCSGFVYYVITNMGIHTTRYSADAFSKVSGWTKITNINSLKPGDLLFWKNGSKSTRIGHTGIYLGNGKFIHASSSNRKVVYGEMKGYFVRNFALARRIF